MDLSSNFGNMFSMAGASLFLPFLPMLATQILLNNLLYDASQFALPLDNVDDSEVQRPRTLSMQQIRRFMWSYGLLSSAFDFATFGILLLVFRADQATFQAGWFLESIVTQILVVYIIRTGRRVLKGSRPAAALVVSTSLVIVAAIVLVQSQFGAVFHFGHLQPALLAALGLITVLYLMCAEGIKGALYGSHGTKA